MAIGQVSRRINPEVHPEEYEVPKVRPDPLAFPYFMEAWVVAVHLVVAIDQIHNHDPRLCKIRESRWIRILGTSYPSGMNLRVDSL